MSAITPPATVNIPWPAPLSSPPFDGITSLSFSPNKTGSEYLLCSSWDATLRLYTPPPPTDDNKDKDKDGDNSVMYTNKAVLQATPETAISPLLCSCFPSLSKETVNQPGNVAFAGDLNGVLRKYDFTNGNVTVVGTHDKGISCVASSSRINFTPESDKTFPLENCLVTGGWDGKLKIWDISESNNSTECSFEHELPGKVFALDFKEDHLLIGCAGRKILCFTIKPHQNSGFTAILKFSKDSPLKYQTRSLSISPNLTNYCIGSIEGRIAVDYFPPLPPTKKYAFKCHRVENKVYPVNCILHYNNEVFCSGGCDGVVCFWDAGRKKRLASFLPVSTSVSAIAIGRRTSGGGGGGVGKIAVAMSYTFEAGERDSPQEQIYLRVIERGELGEAVAQQA